MGCAPATSNSPCVAPKSAPASSDSDSVPGTANACISMYAMQNPASTQPCAANDALDIRRTR